MKNIFLLLLLFTGIVKAQIVDIPDANFKAKLLEANTSNSIAYSNGFPIQIDANNDGEIENSEAVVVDSLGVSSSNISSLIGISNFTNLKRLSCSTNNLTGLDVTNLTNLEKINCAENQLTSLFVSGLNNLKVLNCIMNQLTVLDLTGLSNLENLFANTNNLSELDLSEATNLKIVYCGFNQITSLNLVGLTQLEILFCASNQLSDLNLWSIQTLRDVNCSQNVLPSLSLIGLHQLKYLRCNNNALVSLLFPVSSELQILVCSQNQLTSLDFINLNQLEVLVCDFNQLTELDFSNNPFFSTLTCSNNNLQFINLKNGLNQSESNIVEDMWSFNANLKFICADDTELISIQEIITQSNLNPVNINSYCSFTPGGNYNTITGDIKYDANSDGCDDNDIIPLNVRLNINDGNNQGASFTNNDGSYIFYTQAGSFQITPIVENPTWFTFSPATTTIPFADSNNNTATQDFCFAPNGVHADLETVISPLTPARPGFDAVYKVVCRNKGTLPMSNWTGLTLNYDNSKMNFVSSSQTPSNNSAGLLEFGYSLNPFESTSLEVTFHINSPLDLNPVNIGNVLTFNIGINPVATDEKPEDNTFIYNQTVVGSYDPNNIICLEGDVVPATEIGKYLHYAINFENTGTFPAENVVVKTEIDLLKFDIGSLQLMNTNFPVDARIAGNKVEFIFENIQLPIGGHGHILLKLKTQNTLVTGDAVANRGDIYFDYNFPIDTGLANTVFQTLSNSVFEVDSSVAVYPNPANNNVTIKSDNKIKSIELYDVQGRIVLIKLMDESESRVDISNYANGIYFLKVATDKGTAIDKIVKE